MVIEPKRISIEETNMRTSYTSVDDTKQHIDLIIATVKDMNEKLQFELGDLVESNFKTAVNDIDEILKEMIGSLGSAVVEMQEYTDESIKTNKESEVMAGGLDK